MLWFQKQKSKTWMLLQLLNNITRFEINSQLIEATFFCETDLRGKAEQWEDNLDRNQLRGEHERVADIR